MAEHAQPPSETPGSSPPAAKWRNWFRAVWPFALTALCSVILSIAVQMLIPASGSDPTALIQTPTTAAANPPAPTADLPASTPDPSVPVPVPDESLLRLEILDLENEDRRLRSFIYLLRAANQLDDAVAALLVNDRSEADRTIIAARRSLDRAYAVSADAERGPIDSVRLELSRIRDDLGPRPENTDRRLRQLRRLVLSLVDEA